MTPNYEKGLKCYALYTKVIPFKADLHFIARDTARQTSAMFLLGEQISRAVP